MLMITIQTTAIVPIGRLHFPRLHGPGWNCDPARRRRRIGMPYAMYRPMTAIEMTAAYA